jgi:thiamine-phosphate pyrophosphorylase
VPLVDVRLNIILDADVVPRSGLSGFAEAAINGGATLLQYRDKTGSSDLVRAVAQQLIRVLAGRTIPLVINDRVEIAADVGADGVHLGQDDMHPQLARRLLGPAAIIGRTVKTMSDVVRLRNEPVDYACIGGVFPTSSKINSTEPLGVEGMRRLRLAIAELWPELPVSAIAGITLDSAGDIIEAGADGIAVISAVLKAADPGNAADELRRMVDTALARRA